MGYDDNRRTPKMRRRKRALKKKARLARKIADGKASKSK